MCKYLFSSGQVPKLSILEPSFIQYTDSVAYLHFQHIPIYIQKFVRAGTNTLKPIRPSIHLVPHEGFSSYKVFYQLIGTVLPARPPSPLIQGTKSIHFFFLLAQTFKYRIKLRKLYIFFIWHTSFLARCAMYKLWLQRKLTV